MAEIRLEHIDKIYSGDAKAVDDFNLHINSSSSSDHQVAGNQRHFG